MFHYYSHSGQLDLPNLRAYSRTRINSQLSSLGVKGWVLRDQTSEFGVRSENFILQCNFYWWSSNIFNVQKVDNLPHKCFETIIIHQVTPIALQILIKLIQIIVTLKKTFFNKSTRIFWDLSLNRTLNSKVWYLQHLPKLESWELFHVLE